MSTPSTTTTAAPQQINVADLELPQLAEVKRQLEEVCASSISTTLRPVALIRIFRFARSSHT
jgi:hypothetical protein